jgi:hypothetical protein
VRLDLVAEPAPPVTAVAEVEPRGLVLVVVGEELLDVLERNR